MQKEMYKRLVDTKAAECLQQAEEGKPSAGSLAFITQLKKLCNRKSYLYKLCNHKSYLYKLCNCKTCFYNAPKNCVTVSLAFITQLKTFVSFSFCLLLFLCPFIVWPWVHHLLKQFSPVTILCIEGYVDQFIDGAGLHTGMVRNLLNDSTVCSFFRLLYQHVWFKSRSHLEVTSH